MRVEPSPGEPTRRRRGWPWLVVAGAGVLGLALIADQAGANSATYDEVTYLRIAANWWRTGEQAEITRMGSPLSFWKLQQVPTFWLIDRFGDRSWLAAPIEHQARLLPLCRVGAAWIWLSGLIVVALWARSRHGDRAMALAAAIFALSPNLLAHGALVTMEMPIVATTAAILFGFDRFLRAGSRRGFWAAAALAGLAFSCKFTAILIPPILAVVWAADLWSRRDRGVGPLRGGGRIAATVGRGMLGFAGVSILTDLALTGFAALPLSPQRGAHPVLDRHLAPALARWATLVLEAAYPADWVGFATQLVYQRQGGPSYLLGERRMTGWWYYYPVTLAVKVPLAAWFLLAAGRFARAPLVRSAERRNWLIPGFIGLFLVAAMMGSKRNYGVRYLLPLAPAAIVAAASLANQPRRWIWQGGLAGMMASVALIHPYELTYFNLITNGSLGGRHVLADSNLDWGQGAVAVARLQAEQAQFRDLTWYAFGDTDPGWYGVVGRRYLFDAHRPPADLPARIATDTAYIGVSASLQWGPWGPAGYFRELEALVPIRYSPDRTVAIYRATDLIARREAERVRTGRGPG